MSSKWHQKKEKIAREQFERELQNSADSTVKDLVTDVAMGGGDEQVFEKKMSKEEKKALAKAKREAKKKAKGKKGKDDGDDAAEAKESTADVLKAAKEAAAAVNLDGVSSAAREDDGIDHNTADALASAGTICTFALSKKGVDARSRDVNVQNFTLQHMGAVLLDETEIVLNHGNRYGLVGANGEYTTQRT